MSRSVRDPDYRVAAGKALYMVEHPHTPDTTWDLLDQPTRDWWTRKAAPVHDAVKGTPK